MSAPASFKKDLFTVFLYALLALFLVPGTTWLFVRYAEPSLDESYRQSMAAEKQVDRALLRALPPSGTCDNDSPGVARYRAAVCGEYSELSQFRQAGKLSLWTLVGGLGVLAAVLALGALAFASRRSQYLSFMLGWNLLAAASALEVVVQGAMVAWLFYWLTAFFLHLHAVNPAVLAAVGAVLAAFFALVCIFKRPRPSGAVAGEPIAEKDAPALWAHVRELASRIGTAPPQHIVAGIDASFFVTESPLVLGKRTLKGRSLFVSLPLLRVLDCAEADALLAHELARFSGGDTASSAALGPRLAQHDAYCRMLCEAKVTIGAYYVMRMYRMIFELALERERRRREHLADRAAAAAVSPQALAASLVKLAAYSCYRTEIEPTLFEHGARHFGPLGIAQGVAAGLARYAVSPLFADAMRSQGMPPLAERMRNVGHVIEEQAFAAIAATARGDTWLVELPGAAQIEARLWHGYEHGFARAREQTLADRRAAANDGERGIVLRYFPPQSFALKGGKALRVGYAGMMLPGERQPMSWDDIADLKYENGSFGTAAVLQIIRPERSWLRAKTTEVKLAGLKKGEKERLLRVVVGYWHRHKVAGLPTPLVRRAAGLSATLRA